jgi:predicted transcriptional regulator
MKALLSNTERDIYTILGALNRAMSRKEIWEEIEAAGTIDNQLNRLIQLNLIKKLGYNKYIINN